MKKEDKIKMDKDRFEKIYSQGTMSVLEIWADTVTGVHYLYHRDGNTGGLKPLLDEKGNVVILK